MRDAAFERGFRSCGDPSVTANPYGHGTRNALRWKTGWECAALGNHDAFMNYGTASGLQRMAQKMANPSEKTVPTKNGADEMELRLAKLVKATDAAFERGQRDYRSYCEREGISLGLRAASRPLVGCPYGRLTVDAMRWRRGWEITAKVHLWDLMKKNPHIIF